MTGGAVLGVNFGTHDAAAALVHDGRVLAAAEEERFTRHKHTKDYPQHAIDFCLERGSVGLEDLHAVAFFTVPVRHLLLPVANSAAALPRSLASLASDLGKYGASRDRLRRLGVRTGRRSRGVTAIGHHAAHAASSYLVSPFENATVVTLDGRGEYETACIFDGREGHLRRVHHILYPHSFGYFYSMLTRYLGFRPQTDEYKVMGLAAHGSTDLVDTVSALIVFDNDTGRLRLDLAYFDHHCRPSQDRSLYSSALTQLLGPPRTPYEPITDRHRAVARAAQQVLQDRVLAYLRFARALLPHRDLCLAGGVALNAVANGALLNSGLFDRVFVQPAAGDAGTSIGAALLAGPDLGRVRTVLKNAFLGPDFTPKDISAATACLRSRGHVLRSVSDPHSAAASLLADGKIIGWFQGRSEFGPRALGARSILADPRDPHASHRVNMRIKRREEFRPLAPAVLADHASRFFDVRASGESVYPFMLATAAVRAASASAIPAVVHIDGSARVQTVNPRDNPGLATLLERFAHLTGVPILLNTSFNDASEPMVNSPADAVATYQRTGLDALVIGSYLLTPEQA